MLARPLLRSTRSIVFGFAVAACVLATAGPASAGTCEGRGYTIVERHAEFKILTKVMKTGRFKNWQNEFAAPPKGTFACSSRFHKRTFLGLNGHGVDGNVWTKSVVANSRYAAWVVGGTNNLDGGGDRFVMLADLSTGRRLGSFPASSADGGSSVTALALSTWGAVGWIESSEATTVWLRTKGKPRQLASGPDIDPRVLKFGDTPLGRALIWSTGDSVTRSPGT